jgi:type IV secretory pathway TrbF-like protein
MKLRSTPKSVDHGSGLDPYRAQRAEVRGTIRRYQRRNYLLSVVLALSLVSTSLATYGLSVCAAKPSLVLIRVDVDRLGGVWAAGRLSRLEPPGHVVLEAELRRVIANLRTVYVEPIAQRDIQNEARSRLQGQALAFVNDYFKRDAVNPFLLGREVYRRVDVYRALPVEGKGGRGESWRLSWRETEHPVGGGAGTECEWEGIATVAFAPYDGARGGEAAIVANPYGIWVVGLSWQQSSACRRLAPAGSQQGGIE